MTASISPVIVEQVFPNPVHEVWEAITRLGSMRQWFFEDIPAFEPQVGFQTRFNVVANGKNFEHRWKIVEADAPYQIKYHWSYTEYPGVGYVTFTLQEDGANWTKLVLQNEGLESFPQDMPEFSRASCQAGWEYFIQGRLKIFLSATT